MAIKPIKEIDIDDMKALTDDDTANLIEEKSGKLLALVKEYETEEKYWFVKYYLSQSFGVFTMGGMLVCINENVWIKPGDEIDETLKRLILDKVKRIVHKDIQEIFEGHEDLMVRIFGYGTPCAQLDLQQDCNEDASE